MFRPAWLRSSTWTLRSRTRSAGHRSASQPRLQLEALEERSLLAVNAASLAFGGDTNNPSLIADTAGGTSDPSAISADGRYVAYVSTARNVIANQSDTNDATDLFLYDRV